MKRFCTIHNRALWALCSISAMFTICLLLTGCNVPQWLQDAQTLIPIILASVTSVLSGIAALTGNPALATALAAITPIINDISAGLTDLEQIIAQYKADPSETLLQQIQSVADTVTANLQKVLTDSGIPAPLAGKIQAWAQLVASQLDAWLKILPAVHVAVHANSLHAMATPPDDRVLDAATLKAKLNDILFAPTGDAEVDAAMEKAPRIV